MRDEGRALITLCMTCNCSSPLILYSFSISLSPLLSSFCCPSSITWTKWVAFRVHALTLLQILLRLEAAGSQRKSERQPEGDFRLQQKGTRNPSPRVVTPLPDIRLTDGQNDWNQDSVRE